MTSVRQYNGPNGCWQHSVNRSDRPAGVDRACSQEKGDRAKELSSLVGAIEGEIIPRLLLVHRADECGGTLGVSEFSFRDCDVEHFVRLAIANDYAGAISFVDTAQAHGATLENTLLHLLAPAARLMGQWWEEDICGFAEVTLGLMQLRQVLHAFSAEFEQELQGGHNSGLSALLIPVPGNQHSFGISVVVEFFRRAGWEVCDEPVATTAELLALVRSQAFDVVGLSVGSVEHLDGLAGTVREIRKVARNRNIRVMLGGKCFNENPELIEEIGADATALDARQAVSKARNLVKSPIFRSK